MGTSLVELLTGTLIASKYVSILERNVVPFKSMIKHFQNDNLSYRKAHSVAQYLKLVEVSPIGWPPYSPDLNPIENICATFPNSGGLQSNSFGPVEHRSRSQKACFAVIKSMLGRVSSCVNSGGRFALY